MHRSQAITLRHPIPSYCNSRSHPTQFQYPKPYSPLVASSTALNSQDTAGITGGEGIACSDCSVFGPEINDRGTLTGPLVSRLIHQPESPCRETYAGRPNGLGLPSSQTNITQVGAVRKPTTVGLMTRARRI